MTRQRKGSARKSIKKPSSTRQFRRKTKKNRKTVKSPSGKEDRPPCVNCKRGTISHNRECDCWRLTDCKYFQERLVRKRKGLSICSPAQDENDLLVLTGKKEVKHNIPTRIGIGCNCEHCKSQFKDYFRKALQVETSRSTHSKAKGNLEQVEQSTTSMKGILALRRTLSSEKVSIRFSHQSLERAKFRDKFLHL